nr:MAG TPA: hypothetical protein [Bacteriophage sp.]
MRNNDYFFTFLKFNLLEIIAPKIFSGNFHC